MSKQESEKHVPFNDIFAHSGQEIQHILEILYHICLDHIGILV